MSGVNKLTDFDDDDVKLAQVKPKQHPCGCLKRVSRILLRLLAAVLTIYVCILSSERYFMYWVQTTIERTDVHVSEIAFPAITICANPITIDNYNKTLNRTEVHRLNSLYNLVQNILWLSPEGAQATRRDFEQFEPYFNLSLDDIKTILSYRYTCKDLFSRCMWRRRPVDCCTLLRPIATSGSCYAFNSLHAQNPDATWPWSVASSGFSSALNVRVNRFVGGIRLDTVGVIVQEPGQYLGTSVIYSTDDRIVVPLQPLRFTAETGVKARPVEMRRCYFSDELKLKGQSRSECISNCHINYISRLCQCSYQLPMPLKAPIEEEPTLRRCTIRDLACFTKHRLSLFSMSNLIEESVDNVFNTTDCKCYPNCDHIQYHASTYTDRQFCKEHNDSYIEVDAYFQEEMLFSYRSTLHITFLDLMVSYGGIAGLILGISVIGGINALLDRIACCNKPSPQAR